MYVCHRVPLKENMYIHTQTYIVRMYVCMYIATYMHSEPTKTFYIHDIHMYVYICVYTHVHVHM